jgi:hypothetical protein
MRTGFCWEKLRERYHFKDPGVIMWIILKWVLEKWDRVAWIGSLWLRIGTEGGIL